jgi:hypothetical protein
MHILVITAIANFPRIAGYHPPIVNKKASIAKPKGEKETELAAQQ